MSINLPSLASQHLWLQKGELAKKWSSVEKHIKEHSLNHAVELFIPFSSSIPGPISSLPLSYYHAHLPISHFLQPHLLSRYFTVGGSVAALSIGRRIDTDIVFALIPPGKLVMSLDKDVYDQLGLQGTSSRCSKNFYIVEIDLTAPSFKPEKPGYKRVKWCITDRLGLEADFILTWDNKDLSAQTQFMDDFNATKCTNFEEKEILKNFCLPLIEGNFPHGHHDCGEEVSCSALDMHTWLGAVSCGLTVYDGGAPGDYVSTFTPPEPSSLCQHGVRTRWTGMVSSHHSCSLLKNIQECLEGDPNLPWMAISTWGFDDAPIPWRSNKHGCFLSGDNHYNIIVFRTGEFWLIKTIGYL